MSTQEPLVLPKTLTEAISLGGIVVLSAGGNATSADTSRTVPYAEYYVQQTGLVETPVERILRAAEDERHRRAETDELLDPEL